MVVEHFQLISNLVERNFYVGSSKPFFFFIFKQTFGPNQVSWINYESCPKMIYHTLVRLQLCLQNFFDYCFGYVWLFYGPFLGNVLKLQNMEKYHQIFINIETIIETFIMPLLGFKQII